MKGIWGILFIGCFYAFATFNVASAVDCSTFTTQETCETDANTGCVYFTNTGRCKSCGEDTYRYKKDDGTYDCAACTNGPSIDGKECGADDAACQYTGNNGDSPNCPWEMTCSNGTIFNPSSEFAPASCAPCPENYESSLGPDSSFVVKWSPDGYKYYTAGSNGVEIAAPQCEGKVYYIEFKGGNIGNGHIITTPNPRFLYEKYDTGFYTDETANTVFNPTNNRITPLVATHEFQGYFTETGTEVFGADGKMGNTITSQFFKNDTTLYAHWGDKITIKYNLILKNGPRYTLIDTGAKNKPCTREDCEIAVSDLTCSAGFYIKNQEISAVDGNGNSYGTIERQGNKVIFKPNDDTFIRILTTPNTTITLDIQALTLQCSINHYCPQCDELDCPYGSTTDNIGKTRLSDCYWNAGTQFTDSTGGTFTLPVSSTAHLDVQIPTD